MLYTHRLFHGTIANLQSSSSSYRKCDRLFLRQCLNQFRLPKSWQRCGRPFWIEEKPRNLNNAAIRKRCPAHVSEPLWVAINFPKSSKYSWYKWRNEAKLLAVKVRWLGPFTPAFRFRIFRGVNSYNPYKCTCKENTKLAANIVLTPDVRGLLKLPTMSQFFT